MLKMNEFIAITHPGIEEITAIEVSEILGVKSEISDSYIRFSCSLEDACRFCYLARSIRKVLLFIGDDKDIDAEPFLHTEKTFAVRCTREGDQDFSSNDMEKKIGAMIHERYGSKADLDDPQVPVHVFARNETIIAGIDLAGFDMSKRTFHVFNNPKMLKGTIAYALCRMSGFKGKGMMIDPFTRSGCIPIEAALYATGKSVHFFDKDKFAFHRFTEVDLLDEEKEIEADIVGYDKELRHVKSSQKNAKIAGVTKEVSFSKADIEWLDTKKKQDEVDFVVTYLPEQSRFVAEKEIRKTYKELFYHLDFIMKKGATFVAAGSSPLLLEIADEYKFKLEEETDIWQGQMQVPVAVLKKR